jgi:hypothetical protein
MGHIIKERLSLLIIKVGVAPTGQLLGFGVLSFIERHHPVQKLLCWRLVSL